MIGRVDLREEVLKGGRARFGIRRPFTLPGIFAGGLRGPNAPSVFCRLFSAATALRTAFSATARCHSLNSAGREINLWDEVAILILLLLAAPLLAAAPLGAAEPERAVKPGA